MATEATNPPKSATPSKVARAVFEALGKKDLDSAGELIADDATDDFVAIGEIRGKAAIRGFFEETFRAFPDFEMTADRVVGDRSTAVVQWHAAGTFSGGLFQGIEPTGRHVEIRGVDVMEVTDGLIRHNTIYYDGAALARQIGLLPRGGSGTDRVMVQLFNAVTRVRRRLG